MSETVADTLYLGYEVSIKHPTRWKIIKSAYQELGIQILIGRINVRPAYTFGSRPIQWGNGAVVGDWERANLNLRVQLGYLDNES